MTKNAVHITGLIRNIVKMVIRDRSIGYRSNIMDRSGVTLAHQRTQDNVRKVLGYHVVVVHFLYHLDVELLLPLRKLRLEHHEEILTVLVLKSYPLRERRHLPRSQVYASFDLTRPVSEEEHVRVVFTSEIFEASDYGESVEALSVEGGIFFEVVVHLVESEWDYGFVADWFVVFFG